MSIKYIFCDIDDTLNAKLMPVCEENVLAIRKAREQGTKTVLSSGRLPVAIYDILDEISIERCDSEYVISSNGSLLITTDSRILYDNPLRKNDFTRLATWLVSTDYEFVSFADFDRYHLLITKVEPLRRWGEEILDLEGALEYIKGHSPYKFLIGGDTEELKRVIRKIEDITEGRVTGLFSHADMIEVVNSDVSKGKAINKLCELTNVDIRDTIAIGDNMNDYTLLEAAAIKTCPANAVPEIKAICDYISPKTAGEGAVADIIEKFVLDKS